MSKIRIQLDELKAAIAEIEGRSPDVKITLEIDGGRSIRLTSADRNDNMLIATVFEDGNMSAQFSLTERLMFMKDKKRL